MRVSKSKMKSDFSMAAILTEKVPTCSAREEDVEEEEEESIDVGLYSHMHGAEKLYKDEDLRISLEDTDLWRSFHAITNEMIVTKNGR